MPISMHAASVPLFTQMLNALSGVLDKGAAFAAARKVEPAVLVAARLAPDMLPLNRQIQIASDGAKLAVARLAGVEAPKYEDSETSFDELKARLAKTVAYLAEFSPAQLDGGAERTIAFKVGPRELSFTGVGYLTGWAIPNVMFHCTTAYDILRHNGVEIGKRDFLGAVPAS